MRIASPWATRVMGVVLASSLVAPTVTGCGDDKPSTTHTQAPAPAAYTDNGVVPEPFVYNNQTYCAYPDDLDDLSMDAVRAYCSEVIDPLTGAPVAQAYWVEADEPKQFNETNTDLATLVWIYYMTYLNVWFMSSMFMNAYLLDLDLHSKYKSKHAKHKTKYAKYLVVYEAKAMFVTRNGTRVTAGQLKSYKVAPRSCRPVAYDGTEGSFVLAGAKPKPNPPKKGGDTSTDSGTTTQNNPGAARPTTGTRPSTGTGGTTVRPYTPPVPTRTC